VLCFAKVGFFFETAKSRAKHERMSGFLPPMEIFKTADEDFFSHR